MTLVDGYEVYIILIICLTGAVALFRQARIWKIATFKQMISYQKQKEKDLPDDELKAYLQNPELTKTALMADRKIAENSHNESKIASIDQQIKMIDMIIKIPPFLRAPLTKIAKKALSRVENSIGV